MDYSNLGKSGLKVSRIGLGCMSFGSPSARQWILPEDEARPFIQRALELGINYFDTANMYSNGASEEILGRALRDFAMREQVVIATKVFYPMREDANGGGLSRKSIMTEIDASLRRLGTDYIDLYQIHRWDLNTPIEETMEALHDVVKAGKVRYIGASSMFAWQFCKAQYTADRNGWTRFISMQPHYNLLYREEEREMLGLCLDEGVGVVPWSPLARGRLARARIAEHSTVRTSSDPWGDSVYAATTDADQLVLDRVGEIAEKCSMTRAQVALAWLLHQPAVTAPIVGVTKLDQLEEAVGAVSIRLDIADRTVLEARYIPHAVAGMLD